MDYPSDLTGYQKALNGASVYLSPEVLSLLERKEKSPQIDFVKHDVFSLGILILECMTLKPGTAFYSKLKREVDEDMVKNNLEGALLQYSNLLVRTVAKLFRKNPHHRIDFKDLMAIWEPYEDSILNFRSFDFDLDEARDRVDHRHVDSYLAAAHSKRQTVGNQEAIYVNEQ